MLLKVNFKLVSKFYSRGFIHPINDGKQWLKTLVYFRGILGLNKTFLSGFIISAFS
jgi:hypothetical protein